MSDTGRGVEMDLSSNSTTSVAVDLIVQARQAAEAGLFRVNGLPYWMFGNFDEYPKGTINPKASELGKHYTDNSLFVLVTHEGNVYWGLVGCSGAVNEMRRDFCGQYGIEPGFVWVP